MDLENGPDGVFSGLVNKANRAEDVDSIPPLTAVTDGVAQSTRAGRSRTMNIDGVANWPNSRENRPFSGIPPGLELYAQPEPQGHQGSILDHPSQPQGLEAEDGLFVIDHSARPPTEDGAEVNLEVYDFQLPGQFRLPTASEAREKSLKQENMYVGIRPSSPERKSCQDDGTNRQDSVDDGEGDIQWIGKRPSYSGKRLPSKRSKFLPSQTVLRHPSKHGLKRPSSRVGGSSNREENDASTFRSDNSSEDGGGNAEDDRYGEGDTAGERGSDGEVEDNNEAAEGEVPHDDSLVQGSPQDGSWSGCNPTFQSPEENCSQAGSDSTEWRVFSPPLESSPEATIVGSVRSEQNGGSQSDHARETRFGTRTKKRQGQELSSTREKEAQYASED